MAGIELVVTDLDGTLWFGHEEIHPAVVPAWHELQRRGITVLVATGRRVGSTRTPLARLGLSPGAVTMNGALVLDLDSGVRYHQQGYTPEDAQRVLDAFRAADVVPCVYVDHPTVDVFLGPNPSTHPDHVRGLGDDAKEADLATIVSTVATLMFGIVGHDAEQLIEVSRLLAGVAETHVAGSDQYGGHSLTVTPLGLSKWVGVVEYCRHAGLDPQRVLAIGDGPNDLELLTGAAKAVVPSNACPEALLVADHVVGSARDGGWAAILDLV